GSGTNAAKGGLSVADQVERGIHFLSKRYKVRKFMAYFQSFTNTYGDPAILAHLYQAATERPEIVALSVGTRPDCVSDEILDVLADIHRNKTVWLELGLQSIHDRTLQLIRRGHKSGVFFETCARGLRRGMFISAHIILGLPGETIEDMILTAKAIAASGIHGVKIHPLYVIAGTPLEKMTKLGEYVPMTMEQAVEATTAVLEFLPQEMVIHRLTSDPHPAELVAPIWMLDKAKVRNYLLAQMETKDIRQGSKAFRH
ncbi:MAG: TIGR01212 family radical SAM protein, partial [Desulfomonilaceae bacterium]